MCDVVIPAARAMRVSCALAADLILVSPQVFALDSLSPDGVALAKPQCQLVVPGAAHWVPSGHPMPLLMRMLSDRLFRVRALSDVLHNDVPLPSSCAGWLANVRRHPAAFLPEP